jgi:hypothetical protein
MAMATEKFWGMRYRRPMFTIRRTNIVTPITLIVNKLTV